MHDIFFSYRRMDLATARPFIDMLGRVGLRVWWDARNMRDNAAITPEIREAIADSKVLLAFYSASYPASSPCQQELIAAWIGAQLMGELPYRRVLVINPEPNFDHIPAVLREQQSMSWASDDFGLAALSGAIQGHLKTLQGTLTQAAQDSPPPYHGMSPIQAPRFVGRLRELWQLHSQLTANRMSIITGVTGQVMTQLRGLGGNGRSLLAREYAIRFGPAYPGGIFWLNAYGHNENKAPLDTSAR